MWPIEVVELCDHFGDGTDSWELSELQEHAQGDQLVRMVGYCLYEDSEKIVLAARSTQHSLGKDPPSWMFWVVVYKKLIIFRVRLTEGSAGAIQED